MADEVKIPRSALGALLITLLMSLMGVAFLLGRQSAPLAPPQVAAVPQSHGPEAPPTSLPLPVGPPPAQPVAPPQPAYLAPPPPQPSVVVTVAPAPPQPRVVVTATAPVDPPEATAKHPAPTPAKAKPEVRAYFAKIDQVMSETESMGDQNQFATQILQQGMNGDSAGFDDLISSTRKASAALSSIAAPPSCREHHHLLVGQLDQSLKLLTKVKSAISSMDTDALTSLASEGHQLQSQANRFKQLDQRLRAGLTAQPN